MKRRNIPDELEERARELLFAAADCLGAGYSMRRRDAASVLVRSSVCLKLSEEGWSEKQIGRVLGKDHSTVHHMKVRMRDMLSLPGMYPEAAEIWKELERTGRNVNDR